MDLSTKNKTTENGNDDKVKPKKDKDIIVEHKKVVDSEVAKRKDGSEKIINEEKMISSLLKRLKAIFKAKKDSWEAPKIIKTNLIKGEITSFFDWRRNLFVLFKRLAVATVLIGVVFLALLIWEMDIKKRGVDIKDEVDDLTEIITEKEKRIEEIKMFHQKITVAEIILEDHNYWTNFFKFLEENLLEDVHIRGAFNGNTDGTYEFTAQAKDYNTLAAQLMIFKGLDMVKMVEIEGGSTAGAGPVTEGGVIVQPGIDFSFTLVLKKDIFHK